MKLRNRMLAMSLCLVMILNCFGGISIFATNADGYSSGFDPDNIGDDWIGLTTTNIGAHTTLSSGKYYFNTNGGKYYLAEDLKMNYTLYVWDGYTATIDLNGHDWSINDGKSLTVVNLRPDATLNLYDCGTTERYWDLDATSHIAVPSEEDPYDFTTTGGAITGGVANAVGGGGVFIQEDAIFNMYSGNIIGNQCAAEDDRQGGGVYNYEGIFNMFGGTIQGNASNKTIAGGVYNRAGSTFNMYGGTIAYNYTATYGGGVYNVGVFNISGGTIEYNTAAIGGGAISTAGIASSSDTTGIVNLSGTASISNNKGSWRCGGIYIAANGTLNMSGGEITDNSSGGGGEAGVGLVYSSSTLNMSGGSITDNTTTGASAGVGYTNGTFELSGDAVIDDNLVVDSDKEQIKESNVYISNGNMIVVDEEFTGTVGVGTTIATGTGTIASGTHADVGTFTSDAGYYLVQVGNTITLQTAATVAGTDKSTVYSTSAYDVTSMFATIGTDITYSLLSGTDTATLDGSSLTVTKVGDYQVKAYSKATSTNPPTTQTATLTVTPATVNITDITTVGTVVNGIVELTNTSGTITGDINDDDVSIDYTVGYGLIDDDDYKEDTEGTYDVAIHDIAITGADADNYVLGTVNGGNGTTVEIKFATPYIAWPTAKDITYGDERSNDDLLGGQVMVKYGDDWFDVTDKGSFVWKDDANNNAGTHTYTVQFEFDDDIKDKDDVDYDGNDYVDADYETYVAAIQAMTRNITQVVHMAEVEFTIAGNITTDSSSLIITPKAENGLTLELGKDYQIYYTDGAGSWVGDGNGGFKQDQDAPINVGSYLIGADFTKNSTISPNYVHAGTMESYAKQIGALEIYETKEPASYKVTFTGFVDGSNISYNVAEALPDSIHILPTIDGYSGWKTTSSGKTVTYNAGDRFPQPAYDVTFTAVAEANLGTLSGTITGTDLDGSTGALSGVVVALVQGSEQVAITKTDSSGQYSFTVPQGRYDLVVTRDYVIRNEETVFVELDANETVNVTIPDTRQNTIFNVAAGMTAITVEGMKDLITASDEIRSIKLELTTATVANTQSILTTAAKDALTAKNCKFFIDLSIQERLSDAKSYGEIAALNSGELLTFYIPLAGIYQGYDHYIVYQDNSSTVKTLTATANSYGESATVSADGSLLTLVVQKSAVYGLGFYDDAEKIVYSDPASVTYTTEAIDTNDYFDAIVSDGTPTYIITGGTGEGTINASTGELTVTKAGTFIIAVSVSATSNYPSISGVGELTVDPATVTISGITCIDRGVDSGSLYVEINEGGLLTGVLGEDDLQIYYDDAYGVIQDTSFSTDETLNTTGENTFDVTVMSLKLTGSDSANYVLSDDAPVTSLVSINTSLPFISWPTAKDITFGTAQSSEDFYGGKAIVYEPVKKTNTDGETYYEGFTFKEITGSFQWVEPDFTEAAAGTYEYYVKFVEDDADTTSSYYDTLNATTHLVTQVVEPAAVTFTMADSTLTVNQGLSITATDENDNTLTKGTDYQLIYNIGGTWYFDGTQPDFAVVGDYLVGASLTANYHHAGTQESTAKQIGAFTIYDTTEPATYSTSFDGYSAAFTDALPQTIHVLPTLDTDQYSGWLHQDGTTYDFESRFTQPDENVVFTPIEAPAKNATISGIITGTDLDGTMNATLSGIGVALYQGSTLIDTFTTGTDGTYNFTVAAGVYNIVVTRDTGVKCEMTVFGDTTEGDYVRDFVLPSVQQNAILDVDKGMPNLAVEGLTVLAAAGTNDGTQDSEVWMKVTASTDENADQIADIRQEAYGLGLTDDEIKLFFNIDIYSRTGSATKYTTVTQTDSPLTFYIPLTGTFQGHDDYIVYRYHDGAVQTLTETANSDGEYIQVVGNHLILHVKFFSLYGIAFANATDDDTNDDTPSTGGGYVPPTSSTVTDDTTDGTTSALPFTDVSVDDWFYEDVLYLYELGLMNGTSATTFDPYGGNSRAMVAQIMYNLAGQPERTAYDFFPDVEVGQWYEEAINWCATYGIVDGYLDGFYRPDRIVSRQELTAILYDHCVHLGYDMSKLNDLSGFKDAPSDWATTYVSWAVEQGILIGTEDSYLNTAQLSTRCQTAVVFARFLRNVYQG